MITALVIAPLLLASVMPEEECASDDNRCRAEAMEVRAADEPSPATAAKLLRAALRSRISVLEETQAGADLCAARATAALGLEIEGQPEASRRDFEAHVEELDATAKALAVRCDEPIAEHQVALLDPWGAPRVDTPVDTRTHQSARRRLPQIAGSFALASGATLLGVAAYGGVRMAAALEEGRALVAEHAGSPADADTIARDAELREEYRSMGHLALGAGIAGGVAVVVGATILGVSRPRRNTTARRAALTPTPSGVVISGRF